MIRFVVTPGHGYTLDGVLNPPAPLPALRANKINYRQLFEASSLPGGTWIFCDLERLAVWELGLAGEFARLMREAGCFRIVNDPARAVSRYELLFRLHAAGFNRFRAWRAEEGIPAGARYPVFIRHESHHGWPISKLIDTPEELEAALDRLPEKGIARRGVIIVEYHAEPVARGVFRKYSAYRIGDRIVADHLVFDSSWLAKYGTREAWTDERFAEEAAYVRENPHAEAVMRAFEIGGIDYGRADYGVVDGEVQIWEINTNPFLPSGRVDPEFPQRTEATTISAANRMAAFQALDTPSKISLIPQSKSIDGFRKRQSPHIKEMVRD